MSVPKLRFPEFVGKWGLAKLADLCALKAGKFIEADQISSDQRDGMYPCYGGNGLRGFVTKYNTIGRYPLVGRQGALCGNIKLAAGKYYATEHALIAEPQSGVNVDWLFYQLVRLNLNRFATGVAQPGLSVEVLNGIAAKRPNESEEQQKIAAFLGAVDAKLAALAARQAALVRFKAGLMQKLFSQQLRFTRDDGGAFPDWQEKELRAVSIINPKSPKLPERFRYIDLESVNAGTLGAVSEIDATEAPSRAQRVLQRGDILFQMVRPYQRNNLHFDLIGVYVGSTGYAQIRAKQNRHYLFQVLHTDEFVNRVLERCTGTGYPAINSNDLGKVTVPFPHPDEQQKIANALSTMDTKIQAVADQVAKLQTFKKGLLQQMFV